MASARARGPPLWLLGLAAVQPVTAASGYFGRGADAGGAKVLLSDVQAITVHAGRHTRGRRAAPVPQLACVGGTAGGKFTPATVQCRNQGAGGQGPQWICEAELDSRYRFGETTVTCEGYDAANDKYILAGSCGVEYTLEYTDEAARSTVPRRHDDTAASRGQELLSLIWLGLLAFVLVDGGSGGLLLAMLGFHLFPMVGTLFVVTLAVSWLFGSQRRSHGWYGNGVALDRRMYYDHGPWATCGHGYGPGWGGSGWGGSGWGGRSAWRGHRYGSSYSGWGARPGFASGVLAGAALSSAASYDTGRYTGAGHRPSKTRTTHGHGGTKLR